MARVNCNALKVGMMVTADVCNAEGMFLFPAGTQLTDRHLTILGSWGVLDVDVDAPEGMTTTDPLVQIAPEELSRLTGDLKARFLSLDEGDPVAMEVFRVMLKREAGPMVGRKTA